MKKRITCGSHADHMGCTTYAKNKYMYMYMHAKTAQEIGLYFVVCVEGQGVEYGVWRKTAEGGG